MGTVETVASLASFKQRGAGTNSERRAALSLAQELQSTRRNAAIETFWCRPNWALAHAWHVALALAGSLLSVASPGVGIALIAVALASLALDPLAGVSLGRRLSREHASQNVVSRATADRPPVTLVITANYDAGRMGLAYRPVLRRPAAALQKLLNGPGWIGWLAVVFACVLATAILRERGSSGDAIGVLQLIPTAALVLALALLAELAASAPGPAAGDNATGAALAITLARALDASSPRHLAVDVVLQGAGDGQMIGLRRYLRRHRSEPTSRETIVLGIAAAGGGTPRWWSSDGSLIPLRFAPRLRGLATAQVQAKPHRGRGVSPAFPARSAGLAALTIGCLDGDGLAPRSHQPADTPEAIEAGSTDRLLELALTLIDAINDDVASRASGTAAASQAAA
jgi:Peptidase family M28